MTEASQAVRLPPEALERFARRALERAGVPAEAAEIAASHLLSADVRGVDTHGVVRLPIYVQRLKRGDLNPKASPEVVAETETTAVMDAHNALGQLAAHRAMELAIRKARAHHLAMVTVRNSNHYGAAAGYAVMAAETGMIGVSSTNTPPLMAPPGGKEKRIGNNPLAIAVPSGGAFPVVLDIAFSVVAAWNLVLAQERGERIPLAWALDHDGRPTDDPRAGFPHGMLRPVGDHKGAGLALMMDILSGVLSGGHFGVAPRGLKQEGPMRVAHFMLVIDVEAFMPLGEFHARMEELVALIKGCPPALGIERVLVPGEPEYLKGLDRQEKGIPLAPWLLKELDGLARALNLSPLSEVT